MPEEQTPSPSAWSVTPDQVIALAAQADVYLTEDGDGYTPDPEFGGPQAAITKRVKKTHVEQWIADATKTVDIVLVKRRRLGASLRTEFETALPPVMAVLAAAYLVDAAYPQRSGVNDQASYGQVLWTRYRAMLEDLKEALDELIAHPPADDEDPGQVPGIAAGGFPTPIFGDDWVRRSTPASWANRAAPGAELPQNRGVV